MLPPVTLPDPLTEPDPNTKLAIMLPPEMLAVVVIFAADTRADTTLPLKLRPAAFKLPPVILPVPLTVPAPNATLPT